MTLAWWDPLVSGLTAASAVTVTVIEGLRLRRQRVTAAQAARSCELRASTAAHAVRGLLDAWERELRQSGGASRGAWRQIARGAAPMAAVSRKVARLSWRRAAQRQRFHDAVHGLVQLGPDLPDGRRATLQRVYVQAAHLLALLVRADALAAGGDWPALANDVLRSLDIISDLRTELGCLVEAPLLRLDARLPSRSPLPR